MSVSVDWGLAKPDIHLVFTDLTSQICQIGIQTGLVRAGNDAGLFLPFCVAMSHSNPLCCTNIKYDFSFFNPNLDQKSYFWGWFNFLALVARLFLKSLFFLTKIFGVISGKICGGDNQVFLTLKYFHTNVLVFVKVRLEHSILSWYLIIWIPTCQVSIS